MHTIRPATPPPDFHLDAALDSLERYRERSPTRIYLAHYGALEDADAVLDEAAAQLRRWVEVAESARREAADRSWVGEHELAHVAETLQRRCVDELAADAAADPERQATLALLSDIRANAAGIVRYLQRRDEGTLTALG